MTNPEAYLPIENHGIIGDLCTAALVGSGGVIDFMCFPRFDSPSIFASLLDAENGGKFQLAPVLDDARTKQIYLPDSNILFTRFLAGDGVAEISDFMPVEPADQAHRVVRRAKTIRGELPFRMLCQPRFNYGQSSHRIEQKGQGIVFVSEGPDRTALRLRSNVPVRVVDGAALAEFRLRAGENAAFILEPAELGDQSVSCQTRYVPDTFKSTLNYWRSWIGQCSYAGRWREVVTRSALTLKLLASAQFGSVLAAPTFGLPEVIGGERNWDYRYSWIRDSSFSMDALMRLGYANEAARFMRWIEDRCQELEPDGALQTLYGIDGRHHLPESALPSLRGYKGSAPVRVGNDAYQQLQLDIYGELLEAACIYDHAVEPLSYDFWRNLRRLIDWVCRHWRDRGCGIWEVRGDPQEFLHEKLMCWTALDRSLRLARRRAFPAPLDRWTAARDEIYDEIYHNYWDERLKAFVQHKGAKTVDAAALLMPLVRFIGPKDPRWLSTLQVIEQTLAADSLVYRYNFHDAAPDGLSGQEGTFTICSFWYVECLARAGDLDKARFFFEKALGYANHLGLFAEELGPRGEHLGNFPQALSHLGLIRAAHELNERLSGPKQPVSAGDPG